MSGCTTVMQARRPEFEGFNDRPTRRNFIADRPLEEYRPESEVWSFREVAGAFKGYGAALRLGFKANVTKLRAEVTSRALPVARYIVWPPVLALLFVVLDQFLPRWLAIAFGGSSDLNASLLHGNLIFAASGVACLVGMAMTGLGHLIGGFIKASLADVGGFTVLLLNLNWNGHLMLLGWFANLLLQ